jgi:hypothetical protein
VVRHNDGSVPATPSQTPPPVRRTRDVLTREEINAKGVRTAYDAIVHLRPEFLRPPSPQLTTEGLRSKQSADQLLEERDGRFPTVFVNGSRQGGPAVLRTIPAGSITDIRYYPATLVPAKYGTNHRDGVIDVRAAP